MHVCVCHAGNNLTCAPHITTHSFSSAFTLWNPIAANVVESLLAFAGIATSPPTFIPVPIFTAAADLDLGCGVVTLRVCSLPLAGSGSTGLFRPPLFTVPGPVLFRIFGPGLPLPPRGLGIGKSDSVYICPLGRGCCGWDCARVRGVGSARAW